ncbi:LOW QUALITY PROTEIN: hypothetical protein PHMEG_00014748 [Phytophthora megakarya]|uniref:SWIM-type domain-containing protein n=1 Tax=Phytophthora megakarya TaxID=4795 RepID=A0A225W361_9STRA|nr:LOW QUALITY PROTEIN: hypothetical protein PHMEG_00014748 [Phytophthora megakarya]
MQKERVNETPNLLMFLLARGMLAKSTLLTLNAVLQYEATLSDINEQFPNARKIRNGNDTFVLQTVGQYLRKIHLTSWTNFGNYPPTGDKVTYFNEHWLASQAYGKPTKLYGIKTTSATEGEKHALIKFDKEISCAAACKVTVSSPTIYYVEDNTRVQNQKQSFKSREGSIPTKPVRTHKVDIESKRCSRCYTNEHLQLPCRHLIAALKNSKDKEKRNVQPVTLFAEPYQVKTYHDAFAAASIDLPVAEDLKPTVNIFPPPIYKQGVTRTHEKTKR